MQSFHSFILSGGSGTRLWPFSRENYPKQFHDFSGSGKPLLADTLERLAPLGSLHVVTTQKLAAGTEAILKRFGFNGGVLGEPVPRNTAAAVLLAVKHHLANHAKGGDDVLGIFPADHVIARPKDFARCISAAIEEARRGSVVTLGIQPHYPATGYGYIEVASPGTAATSVTRFLEKPSLEKAKELLSTQRVFWNAGIFVFQARVMLELFAKHMPALFQRFEALKPDLSNLAEIYGGCESVSVDVGIMEKVSGLKCVPADMGWTDLGSWEEIAAFAGEPENSYHVSARGNHYMTILDGEEHPKKPVVFVGVEDLVVTETPDALMILKKGQGQQVREAVKQVEKKFPQVTQNHTFENRPWGRFEILRDTDYYKSKIISVLPGQRLSYQSHAKRAEHWTVVKGEAEVTLNDQVLRLKAGEHVFIPLGAKHRIANPAPAGSDAVMEFIEVQTGSYFGEDDITRYSDDYGRKS